MPSRASDVLYRMAMKQIQSVNNIKVGQWCRATYKGKKLANISNLFPTRISEQANLRFARYAEVVVWAYVETKIFSAWLPGLSSTLQDQLAGLHRCIAAVGVCACNAARRRWLG